MDKKIFVIIVTYNGARWIDKNIPSLLDSAYPVRIIVVDNKSTDNTLELLNRYPELDIIKSETNLGFGKANNIGMQRALDLGADYLFLLNQDAWVFENTISSLVSKMQKYPDLGLLSPLHYSADVNDLDQSFATYYSRKTKDLDKSTAVAPFVNAAAWMLSRNCVEMVGFFEPFFGHYGEDRNYCDRVSYHKFLIGIDADAKIVHDRVITRNFNKDITQSKFKILASLLNPNHGLFKAYVSGLKEVLGLPKYFSKFYGLGKAFSLLIKLCGYYVRQLFNIGQIIAARKKSL
ncbi:glycosyl transferase [Flavobacterium rivuli WB 3.3-2 = DSM 21788]|uniref:Glycosyl transferase n=1 Tax=Flavobacterium rivuli WB 3.3-2 = DSM 21788 TaxID=1121895 RepID=A0A0A2M7C7_9FLAO|nr:glycosyltransferase family 2 protein [Flavobacterium rivuli]KGO87378.1 glycosyl transferase [Flavobacterium rivuli WB 3.3-2 = DSM 21788]